MKSKFFFVVIGIIFLVTSISTYVFISNKTNTMAEIFNANVEILADSESSGSVMCVKYIYYSPNRNIHLCSSCNLENSELTTCALCTVK